MEKENEVNDYLIKFQHDEKYIDYFIKFALDNLRYNPKYMKYVMEKVFLIARKNDYKNSIGECLLYLSWYYHDNGEYNKSIKYQRESYEIFLKLNNEKSIVKVFNGLIANYTKLGMFVFAIEFGLKAIAIAEKLRDYTILSSIIINTAVAYLDYGKFCESLELIERLFNLNKDNNYELQNEEQLLLYTVMIEIKLKNDEIYDAYKYFKKGYNLSKKMKCFFYQAEFLYLNGKIQHKFELYSESEKSFEDTYNIALNHNNKFIIVKTLIEWGKCKSNLCDYSKSEKLLLNALKYAKEIKSTVLLKDIYSNLSDLYKNMGDFKNAFESLENKCKYEKEIMNDTNIVIFDRFYNKTFKKEANTYKKLYSNMNNISHMGRKITSILNKDKIFGVIAKELSKIIELDIFAIALSQNNDKFLTSEIFVESGCKLKVNKILLDDDDNLGVYCYKTKKEILINNFENEYRKYVKKLPKYYIVGDKVKSAIYCPLIIENEVIGVLTIQSKKENKYTIADLNILKIFSSYAAIAIKNSLLFSESKYLASYDSLTGVLNRREILRIGEEFFKATKKDNINFSVMMIDVDHFKKINDTLGHCYGDYVLTETANVISKHLEDNCVLGRYGGEEFIIIVLEQDICKVKDIAKSIQETIELHTFEAKDMNSLKVTVSIGLYFFNKDENSFFEGVKFADKALYDAKNSGRNKVKYFN
ncbi:GGDEF domain-containing protein [Clostridium ihumii]|uniref:GGDEF domain-containing protein n=1 Tax=Clostridium ihumii TaxID=1470356 RepID=UPI00058DC8C0|nr:GGDEF domain-containing protein [Clostridium ihumii]